MPAQKKYPNTTNIVEIQGTLAELEIRKGTKADPDKDVLNISGSVQIGDDPSFKVPFRNVYPIYKLKKNGDERKDYKAFLGLDAKFKSIAQVGIEEASRVKVSGRIAANDWVNNQDGTLVEGTVIEPISITRAESDKEYSRISFKGYLKSVIDERDSSDEETGRLRVEVIGIDGMGAALPFRFIVEEEIKEEFTEAYEVEDTATFYISNKVRKIETQTTRGGIGQQWTNGRARVERVLAGATPPVDQDEKGAIKKATLKEAIAKRKQRLEDLKARNEEYRNKTAEKAASASATSIGDDDDFEWE